MNSILTIVFLIAVACAAGLKPTDTILPGTSSEHPSIKNTIIRKLKPGPKPSHNHESPARDRLKRIKRVSGGAYAWDMLLPYQVALTMVDHNKMGVNCGGTLIGHEWVVTAAHCVARKVDYIEVGFGSIHLHNPFYKTWASMVYLTTDWDPNTIDNDIALLKIPYVEYNERISPALLPPKTDQNATYIDKKVVASGWGVVNDDGETTNYLKYADLTVIEFEVCAIAFGFDKGVTSVICAWTPEGHSTCTGDSGGPVVVQHSRLLIGLSSFVDSHGCTKGMPIGFTRISSYLDWIHDCTGISESDDSNIEEASVGSK